MNQPFRNALLVLVLLAITGGGLYLYTTRETKGPTPTPVVATNPASPTPTPTPTPALATKDGETLFRINQEGSKAEYRLDELLRGEPITVVGTTSNIEGSIAVNRADLPASRLSPIRINARTFKTDSDRRDNAVRRMILKSEQDAFEHIEFKTTKIQTPKTAANGESFPIEIIGDLTVAGATKEATFKGTAKFSTDSELTGDAQAIVTYGDFGIQVPDLPFLANVDKQTTLNIHFVAKP